MIDFSKGAGYAFKINGSKQNRFFNLLLLILLCCTTVSFAQQTYSGRQPQRLWSCFNISGSIFDGQGIA